MVSSHDVAANIKTGQNKDHSGRDKRENMEFDQMSTHQETVYICLHTSKKVRMLNLRAKDTPL